MRKTILSLIFIITLSLTMNQSAFAAEIAIKLVGQNEGWIHAPIERNGVEIFPIGQILNFLDISGTETVYYNESPAYSFVTFQGQCFKITHGKPEVQEYELDESGSCLVQTGDSYRMEVEAGYLDSYNLGIFVPLSFISDILQNPKFGNKFTTHYNPKGHTLEFTMVNNNGSGKIEAVNPVTLAMKINSPWLLTKDDGNLFDENDHSVTPIIRNSSTLLPIAPIIKQMGGTVHWNGTERKVTITLNQNSIDLWIDSKSALVNGVIKKLEVPPTIIKGKTMLPVRFVTENLGAKLLWDGNSQMILIYYGGAEPQQMDLLEYNYKISMLDAFQKQEDNRQTLADVVEQNKKKHEQVQYNNTDPLDYYGKWIHIGDRVALGTFSGYVKDIRGTKVLVYWDTASFLVDPGKEREMSKIYGITWLADQWMDAKAVVLSE
ncbi:copper amine oxidase N-terminal domain-containing protein [Brevibacillus gelatini]|uniref:copper amine oxidase N-terminal domain-containing protein n=1 Tax=Brevibacillus gelatini TaxID=1655277 RepID=UPI003D818EEE